MGTIIVLFRKYIILYYPYYSHLIILSLELSAGLGQNRRIQQTIGTPHITILSDDSALIAYSRIVQYQDG